MDFGDIKLLYFMQQERQQSTTTISYLTVPWTQREHTRFSYNVLQPKRSSSLNLSTRHGQQVLLGMFPQSLKLVVKTKASTGSFHYLVLFPKKGASGSSRCPRCSTRIQSMHPSSNSASSLPWTTSRLQTIYRSHRPLVATIFGTMSIHVSSQGKTLSLSLWMPRRVQGASSTT